jgi:hypothetical protein
VTYELAMALGVEARVEIRAVPPSEPVQQGFLKPIRHASSAVFGWK